MLEMALFPGPAMVWLLAFVLLIASRSSTGNSEAAVTPSHSSTPFNRTLFPADFILGAGSAAYQVLALRPTKLISSMDVRTRVRGAKRRLHKIIIIHFLRLKVQLISMEKDPVFGILSLRIILVILYNLSLFFRLFAS